MGIILVSDIFGKTPALITLAKELNAESIIDPYNGNDMAFDSEADAYAYFSKQVGLDAYFEQLTTSLTSLNTPKTLIGFSIGAAIIWRLSAIMAADNIKNAFCFYGSQIRNYTEIEPRFAVNMIFPQREDHFDVLALQNKMAKKANTKVINTNYLHGFMNHLSDNYNQTAYREYINILRASI
jgi:dienelactone hydrolase